MEPLRKLQSPVVSWRYLSRPDHPRRVDRYINYFGDSSASSKPVKNDGRYREAYASCMRSRGDTGRPLERERLTS